MEQSATCVYINNTRMAKDKMRTQIDELEQSIKFATQIFHLLASDIQVSIILQSLRDGQDWATIARAIRSSSASDFTDVPKFEAESSPSVPAAPDSVYGEELSTVEPSRIQPFPKESPSPTSLKHRLMTCDPCRFKHQKCDSQRPICGPCRRRRFQCTYTDTLVRELKSPNTVLHQLTAVTGGREEKM